MATIRSNVAICHVYSKRYIIHSANWIDTSGGYLSNVNYMGWIWIHSSSLLASSPRHPPYLPIAPIPTPPNGLEPLLVYRRNPRHGPPWRKNNTTKCALSKNEISSISKCCLQNTKYVFELKCRSIATTAPSAVTGRIHQWQIMNGQAIYRLYSNLTSGMANYCTRNMLYVDTYSLSSLSCWSGDVTTVYNKTDYIVQL